MTGYLPTRFGRQPLAYESRIERDALMLLQFDHFIVRLETQPFTIEYELDGKMRRYTPDIRASWGIDHHLPFECNDMIFEVKPSDKSTNFTETAKFRRVKEILSAQGFGYAILTEQDIRTQRLQNAELLMPYWDIEIDETLSYAVKKVIRLSGQPTKIGEIVRVLTSAGWPAGDVIAAVRSMIVRRYLPADLNSPINDQTLVCYWLEIANGSIKPPPWPAD